MGNESRIRYIPTEDGSYNFNFVQPPSDIELEEFGLTPASSQNFDTPPITTESKSGENNQDSTGDKEIETIVPLMWEFTDKDQYEKVVDFLTNGDLNTYDVKYQWDDFDPSDNPGALRSRGRVMVRPNDNEIGTKLKTSIEGLLTSQEQSSKLSHAFKWKNTNVGYMQNFLNEALKYGIPFRITAGREAKGHAKDSRHKIGYALDITPIEGWTWEQLIEKMRQSPLLDWMEKNGYGIYAESKNVNGKEVKWWHISRRDGADTPAYKNYDEAVTSGWRQTLFSKYGGIMPRVNELCKKISRGAYGMAMPDPDGDIDILNPQRDSAEFYTRSIRPRIEVEDLDFTPRTVTYTSTNFDGIYPDNIQDYIRNRQASAANLKVFKLSNAQKARFSQNYSTIEKALNANGVPLDLANLVLMESGANPDLVSAAGALGPWQIMPNVGAKYGLTEDDLKDWTKSTDLAAKMLKRLYGRFGSWDLAVMAYNCGAGSVSGNNGVNGAISRAGLDPKNMSWTQNDIWKIWDQLPKETRDFYLRWLSLGQQ